MRSQAVPSRVTGLPRPRPGPPGGPGGAGPSLQPPSRFRRGLGRLPGRSQGPRAGGGRAPACSPRAPQGATRTRPPPSPQRLGSGISRGSRGGPSSAFPGSRDARSAHWSSRPGAPGEGRRRPNRFTRRLPAPRAATPALLPGSRPSDAGAQDKGPGTQGTAWRAEGRT